MAFSKITYSTLAVDAVVELLKSIKENREPNLQIINHFNGFGGIKEFLFDPNNDAHWEKCSPTIRENVKRLHDAFADFTDNNPNRINKAVNSVKNSVLTSFFTDKEIIKAMIEPLVHHLPNNPTVLDPSTGNGKYLEVFQDVLNNNFNAYGVEKERLSAFFAKANFKNNPNVTIDIGAFEEVSKNYADNSFDFIFSNIPFGDIKINHAPYLNDKNKKAALAAIHNFFFIKSLDLTKPGGFVAFITSTGVMDSNKNKNIREWIVKNSSLVGAVRLPNNTFQSVGTEVTSDIILLQKRDKEISLNEINDNEKAFINTSPNNTLPFNFNDYYKLNPELVIGDFGTNKMYGRDGLSVFPKNPNESIEVLASNINSSVKSLVNNFLSAKINKDAVPKINLEKKRKKKSNPLQYDLFSNVENEPVIPEVKNSPVYVNLDDFNGDKSIGGFVVDKNKNLFIVERFKSKGSLAVVTPVKDIGKDAPIIADLITLFGLVEKLKLVEIDKADLQLRNQINQVYSQFVDQHGRINELDDVTLSLLDDKAPIVKAYENFNDNNNQWSPADVISKGIFREDNFKTLDNYEDAVFASLGNKGKIDIKYINTLMGKSSSQEDVLNTSVYLVENKIAFLSPVIPNPTSDSIPTETLKKAKFIITTKDELQSGRIADKIKAIELNKDKYEFFGGDKIINNTLYLLKAVEPIKIPIEELDINLGEGWIDKSVFVSFAQQYFNDTTLQINELSSGSYNVTISGYNIINESRLAVNTKSNRTIKGIKLLEHALHGTFPTITYTVKTPDSEKKYIDKEAMSIANQYINDINNAFKQWVYKNTELSEKLENIYYNKFSADVKRVYDGQHLTFPGLNTDVFKPYNYQKDAVWQNILCNGILADHKVGAGKSLVMAMSAMEMKRLGVVKKPMIIAMNANVKDLYRDFMKAYPNANVLAPTDAEYKPEKRTEFLNRVAYNDWDCVILSHNQYSMIRQDEEIQLEIVQEELDNLVRDMETMLQGERPSKRILNGLEKRKANLEAHIKSLQEAMNTNPNVPTFKQMGIDHLMVDESQVFKNLTYTSRHTNVSGMGSPEGSKRALNLLTGVRTLQKLHNGDKGVSFYSGTPISNSLVEMYLIQKYLRPNHLKKIGIFSFDQWARTFAELSVQPEITVTNQIKNKSRFRAFLKVPELSKMYLDIAHVVGDDEMKHVKKPKVEIKHVKLDPSPDQERFTEDLVWSIQNEDFNTTFGLNYDENQMQAAQLIVTGLAAKGSLDLRLVNEEKYKDATSAKLEALYHNVWLEYQDSNSYKGTQFIFCDIGTPSAKAKKENTFIVYDEIKNQLVQRYNINPDEIEFIHNYKSKNQKRKLFDKVNDGEVRIVLGSTEMMGVGVNMQNRCIAMHELDCPWRPSDTEQRHGRGARQGNWAAEKYRDNKVNTYQYAVRKSLDAFKFFINDLKSQFISQVKQGSTARRVSENDVGDNQNSQEGGAGMSMAELIAYLTGQESLIKKMKKERELEQLQIHKNAMVSSISRAKTAISSNVAKIEKLNRLLKDMKKDAEAVSNLLDISQPDVISTTKKSKDGKVTSLEEVNPKIKGYSISINGKTFTDTKTIGKELKKAYAAVGENCTQETSGTVKIAQIGDFNLYCNYSASLDNGNDLFSDNASVISIFKSVSLQREQFSSASYKNKYDKIPLDDNRAGIYIYELLKRIPQQVKSVEKQIEMAKNEINVADDILEKTDISIHDQKIFDLKLEIKELDLLIEKEMNENNSKYVNNEDSDLVEEQNNNLNY